MLIRCAPYSNKGKARQYTAFALLSLAVVAVCVFAYPHVRRGQLLVVESERLWAQGKVEQALESLRAAMRQGGIPIGSVGGMLDAALKVGEGRIARDLALILIDKGRPVSSGLVGRAAGLLDAEGDARGALDLLEKRRAMGPLARPESLHLADLLRREGRFDEAMAQYAELLAQNPGDTAAGADRVETLIWMRRYAEAEQAARDMLTAEPASRAAQFVLARALAAAGKTEAAIAEYNKLLGGKP